MRKLIVGISAADGVQIGMRLLELLREIPEVETHLVLSTAAELNFQLECGIQAAQVRALADFSYAPENMAAAIASGSFKTEGMIVAPCSMKTLAAIAHGCADNLLVRAADVCLKEQRKVVLIPRETPLSRIHMIVPPMLTFYNKPADITAQMDHIIGKALMSFDLTPSTFHPWEGIT